MGLKTFLSESSTNVLFVSGKIRSTVIFVEEPASKRKYTIQFFFNTVAQRMKFQVSLGTECEWNPVTDCVGVSRRMSIPSDMSYGHVRWSELK